MKPLLTNPRRSITIIAALTSLGLTAAIALGRVGLWWPLVEPLSHLAVPYAVVGAAAFVAMLLARAWRWSWLPLIPTFIAAAQIAPLYLDDSAITNQPPDLRVMAANIWYGNKHYDHIVQQFRNVDPDVAVFLEIKNHQRVHMRKLHHHWPHAYHLPESKTKRWDYRISVYSKFPLEELELPNKILKNRAIFVKGTHNGKNFVLIATHPYGPHSEYPGQQRNQFNALANYARESNDPVILIGDLNTTPWSPMFRRLIHRSGLHDARRGFGILPTWNTKFAPIMIPIDHCLVSDNIAVADFALGPAIHSDHLPLIVDLAFK